MSDNILKSRVGKWLSSPALSPELRDELMLIKENEEELRCRFLSPLSFGTAGLRAVMGAGDGYMNVHTVAKATQGFSDYITAQGGGEVVIACDTRNNSELFAKKCAEVLSANGIKSYIFDSPRPTPELSFALRYLGCIAGINITASHNPKEYNGYKAYWSDGAQLSPEQAEGVSECIEHCDIFDGVKSLPFDKGVESGMITVIGEQIDREYYKAVLDQRIDPSIILSQSDMSVVYTPLHGAGGKAVPEVLAGAGLERVFTVAEQALPDGSFPTVKFPNPEFPEVFEPGIRLAREVGSELIIATDPDADRMGIMIKSGDGYIALTGNQVGCLLLDYIIQAYREKGELPEDAYAVKSIVTTALAERICLANGVKMYNVLTGFKFIGEVIKNHEQKGYGHFLLGFEESYGYLKGTYARDKDAVVASLLVCEMAAYYRAKGMTLKNVLDCLYEKYGFFKEEIISLTVGGSDGREKMKAMMERLRACPPKKIAGEDVISVCDYLSGEEKDVLSGRIEHNDLPASDVISFKTASTVTVFRPSGTEPKIKTYIMVSGRNEAEVSDKARLCRDEAAELTRA